MNGPLLIAQIAACVRLWTRILRRPLHTLRLIFAPRSEND
jgi:hypothetical protein